MCGVNVSTTWHCLWPLHPRQLLTAAMISPNHLLDPTTPSPLPGACVPATAGTHAELLVVSYYEVLILHWNVASALGAVLVCITYCTCSWLSMLATYQVVFKRRVLDHFFIIGNTKIVGHLNISHGGKLSQRLHHKGILRTTTASYSHRGDI